MKITTNKELIANLSKLPEEASAALWVDNKAQPIEQVYFNMTDCQIHVSDTPHDLTANHPDKNWWEDGPILYFEIKDDDEEIVGLSATEILDYAEKGLEVRVKELNDQRFEIMRGKSQGLDEEDSRLMDITVAKHIDVSRKLMQLRKTRKLGQDA